MTRQVHYLKNGCVGVYANLTNTYCLIGASECHALQDFLYNELDVPIVPASVCDNSIVGRLTAGNSKGLLVSA
jgi:translation initiation factor 6